MAVWVALFVVFSSLCGVITAADEVVLTSSEKKNPDEMDMTFGQSDPVHIEEVKRELADPKKKRSGEPEPKIDGPEKPEENVLGPLTPLEETPQKAEIKPVPATKSEDLPKEEKKMEKRRIHRGKPSLASAGSDKDGIEVA